ncbi:MAG TPA: uroporphyrinogen-III C-methyltransferase [Gammaproteobacteria bacterium]|nr:uroporphyrinogen-III C-methyltransferase [Gammaproteobacteria bacterium]
MDFFPVYLKLTDASCLVVGGGKIAERKIDLLRRAGARVTVVSPTLIPALRIAKNEGQISHQAMLFSADALEGHSLVIAATNQENINRRVALAAKQRNIPVNVVDRPDLCSFIIPSIVDRSPVIIAISTGGASPILARLLKSRLETLIPATYGRLAALARAFRADVQARFSNARDRRIFWEDILQGPTAELVFARRESEARESLKQALSTTDPTPPPRGEVYLVGAGPGDPDLLTFRALRLMQQADVVLYDRLVAPAIVDLVRRDAERLYVGKKKSDHSVPQPDINQLLVELATSGKRVLRLKGGDPFVFGRGGEEIADLVSAKIPFQVIPGITAASGCAAYAGIPLTHRDFAQSCTFVTGHLKGDAVDLNFKSLAQPDQTVIVYMSLTGLEVICQEMCAHGAPPDLPAALIEQGTTAQQRVIVGTLASLPEQVAAANVQAPTLLIIGKVVTLHDSLGWFRPDTENDAVLLPRPESSGQSTT